MLYAAGMRSSALARFIAEHPRLLVLTGAGCSTESGIPDYRDAEGGWKRPQPILLQKFVTDAAARRRYWARAFVGFERIRRARPNAAHRALAELQRRGGVHRLVTQNVDGLHQAAGSREVIDLHGRIDRVCCIECGRLSERSALQELLTERNPVLLERMIERTAHTAPDGDAELEGPFGELDVPACGGCGGLLKPDVVFFGESVPPERVTAAMDALERADGLLVVGSSLMVYSGYRFAQAAARLAKPIAAVNLGRTRADALLALKVSEPCARALEFLLAAPSARAEWAEPRAGTPA